MAPLLHRAAITNSETTIYLKLLFKVLNNVHPRYPPFSKIQMQITHACPLNVSFGNGFANFPVNNYQNCCKTG